MQPPGSSYASRLSAVSALTPRSQLFRRWTTRRLRPNERRTLGIYTSCATRCCPSYSRLQRLFRVRNDQLRATMGWPLSNEHEQHPTLRGHGGSTAPHSMIELVPLIYRVCLRASIHAAKMLTVPWVVAAGIPRRWPHICRPRRAPLNVRLATANGTRLRFRQSKQAHGHSSYVAPLISTCSRERRRRTICIRCSRPLGSPWLLRLALRRGRSNAGSQSR